MEMEACQETHDIGAAVHPQPSWRAASLTRLRSQNGTLLLAAAVVTAGLWFSHMPSLLLRAQFYADDGYWFQAAYSEGPLLSIAQTGGGYVVLLPRLAASASLALPIAAAPTFFNIVALLIEVAGICYLLSSRMSSAIPALWLRVAVAVLVIALPNAYDTSGNLTNAQWHLALIAFLVLFANDPRRMAGWVCDVVILLLAGLTGPYSVLLLPISTWQWWKNRSDRRRSTLLAIVFACAATQVAVIAATGVSRDTSALDPGAFALVTMLGRQLTIGLTTGARGIATLASTPFGTNPAILTFLAAIPVMTCSWAAWRGPAILRSFCFFAFAELVVALAAPDISAPRWPNLGRPADVLHFHPGGIRYFFYPLLAFAISLGWLAWRGASQLRTRHLPPSRRRRPFGAYTARVAAIGAAGLLLLTVSYGVPHDWLYPPYLDLHWGTEAARITSLAPGRTLLIPINPHGWALYLAVRR